MQLGTLPAAGEESLNPAEQHQSCHRMPCAGHFLFVVVLLFFFTLHCVLYDDRVQFFILKGSLIGLVFGIGCDFCVPFSRYLIYIVHGTL